MRPIIALLLLLSACDYGGACAGYPPAGECWLWDLDHKGWYAGVCCDDDCNCIGLSISPEGEHKAIRNEGHGCSPGAVIVNDNHALECDDDCNCEWLIWPNLITDF